ncbi:hypothetical protein [Micromonospora sp. NPDC007230]|uniref:hypothetical protein n=1 Tax=Micromonospora sp. NPDC007230 TaxID=3364237 RepID=UPI0036A6536B
MRVFDRLTAVVVALAFVLVGLEAPAHGETPGPGAAVTAAHRSIGHDTPSVDPRAVVVRPAPPDTPPDLRTELLGGPCGDHRAGVSTDGPDDLLPAPPVPVGGPPHPGLAPTRYRPPALPLPPRGTLLARAPPTVA